MLHDLMLHILFDEVGLRNYSCSNTRELMPC